MKRASALALVACIAAWSGSVVTAGEKPVNREKAFAFKSCDSGTTKVFEERTTESLSTLILPKSGNKYSAHVETDGKVIFMAFQAARSSKIEFLTQEVWMKKLLDESPAYYRDYRGQKSDCTIDRAN